ncbi:Type II and III secretion system protein [Candidatus Filomicrobium marinum]|uniref:Type II and III secretion system protein n=1 Tax=Candidatus Filomicrobium marinum TaxID=1608628 RepID=A0A0D6JET8_9HYPH|nr:MULTISPECIES: type II and III secretion system protein family protein [Filomicrobium]MCV0370303.1 type II and III secretion system protein family protein [Filomicrobium sp.]CFX22401.1 Type II and III secretion system protein [Candidatus Filomicrobium marinum]CPR18913.1 Type II and III secretion system protein [Candidatus Filomicrobium marinum]
MQVTLKENLSSALTVLVALVAACFVVGAIGDVQANGDYANGGFAHSSVISISDADVGPVRRNIRLGLGKSVLVEFPRDVRDVLVSNPQAVDAVVLSSNRVFLLARRIGESNAFFFDANGEQFATLELFVERETAGLEDMLNRLIPGSAIKVEMINQTVILTGHVRAPTDASRAADIARQFVTAQFDTTTMSKVEGTTQTFVQKNDEKSGVINLLQVEGEEQVMLRVVVAEVQRSMLKQFGINIGAAINSGNFSTNILTENMLPLTVAAGLGGLPIPGFSTEGDPSKPDVACGVGALCNYATNGPINGAYTNNGVSGGWSAGGNRITHALRALERNGLVRTLAEPNLTAISGEPAKFLAGGEFPIPVVDSQGQTSVVFKEFGVGVSFTPTVLSEGRISLKIETEVSELSNQGAVVISGLQIPALQKRQANSTVELPSGGSLALAGLLSESTRQNIDGFPGLKDVPVLGTLFRSRDFIKEETELVVIVTPYMVRPTARKDLARPLDGLGDATDRRANFLGHVNRIYGRGPEIPYGGLKGDYGFIVE